MFEDKTEKQARKEILNLVSEYCDRYHKPKEYVEGARVPYASRVYDHDEMVNLVDASLEFWLTSGKYTEQFEQTICDYLGIQYCSFVNSGSSANLLAFMALTSPLLDDKCIRPGDEVITVACGFPTTVTPIIQYGAIPVFVDVAVPQYNIDVSMLDNALSDKTKAVMIAHTLGNPFDIQVVKNFCDEHNLWLVEDNCDALGSKYIYNGKMRFTGTVGDIGTSSFYPPHHITTGEGGAVYTNNALLHKIVRSFRDWGRDCCCPSGKDNCCGHRFDVQYGQLPLGYDHKYVYSHFGYNLKATDLQAAIGCAQIEKFPGFVEKRKKNHAYLYEKLKYCTDVLTLPKKLEGSDPSWFGFIISCRNGKERDYIVSQLESSGIQTRMLFAGNIIRHPCFYNMKSSGKGYRVVGSLEHTDNVMNRAFWIGVYPGMTIEMLDYMANNIITSVEFILRDRLELK